MLRRSLWGFAGLLAAVPCALAGIGSVSLIDASGLEFLINTDVTFATSSNASGAALDAAFTGAVAATTSGGGTTSTALTDAFNGYSNLFVDGTGYNLNGAVEFVCDGREIEFAPQTIGSLRVQRKVFVPDDDSFCRWLNIIKNNGGDTTASLLILNNLGSESDTVIAATSQAPLVATTADDWVVSYEDYTAGKSPDPRLSHVFQGPNRRQGISSITFANGNGQPFWEYEIDINAGATVIVMNLVSGQPSIAEAIAKAEELALVPETAVACLSDTERSQVVNFDVTEPTCTMTSSSSNPTNLTTIPVTVTFSEPVTGFTKTDIVPTNATVKNFDGSGAVYTFNLVPLSSGLVAADIGSGVAEDAGGNPNREAETFSRSLDGIGPTVAMSSTTPEPSNITRIIDVTATFSEPVSDFTAADITLVNCTLEGFAAASKAYTQFDFRLLPARITGQVGADIAAGVAHDAAGNPNSAAEPFRHTVGPGFSCIGTTTSKAAPSKASLAEIAPIAAVMLILSTAAYRRKKN
ncbi:MAG: hypothetical protein HUU46_14090 [Candidatus Hydrogenedentes bacterium]|nr:hypothetical protein [Candidatus Hydrogenedentota bacterium]